MRLRYIGTQCPKGEIGKPEVTNITLILVLLFMIQSLTECMLVLQQFYSTKYFIQVITVHHFLQFHCRLSVTHCLLPKCRLG